jgi:hypothetical protein
MAFLSEKSENYSQSKIDKISVFHPSIDAHYGMTLDVGLVIDESSRHIYLYELSENDECGQKGPRAGEFLLQVCEDIVSAYFKGHKVSEYKWTLINGFASSTIRFREVNPFITFIKISNKLALSHIPGTLDQYESGYYNQEKSGFSYTPPAISQSVYAVKTSNGIGVFYFRKPDYDDRSSYTTLVGDSGFLLPQLKKDCPLEYEKTAVHIEKLSKWPLGNKTTDLLQTPTIYVRELAGKKAIKLEIVDAGSNLFGLAGHVLPYIPVFVRKGSQAKSLKRLCNDTRVIKSSLASNEIDKNHGVTSFEGLTPVAKALRALQETLCD